MIVGHVKQTLRKGHDMPLEDIEIKDPAVLSKEMGESIFKEIFPDRAIESQDGEQKMQGDAQPVDQIQEDVPNFQIRLDKMRDQRDNSKKELDLMKQHFSEMKGKVSVLEKKDDDEIVNPTEYMDDTQKYLYGQNQQMQKTIESLVGVVKGMKTGESERDLQDQENRFFDNKPELKEGRQKIVDSVLDYLSDKPEIKEMMRNKKLNLTQVYAMYSSDNPKSVKKTSVSNPDTIFSGHSQSIPAGKAESAESDLVRKKAIQILNDPNSTNKKQATQALNEQISQSIISELGLL